ncbi:EutN/CcmL family microcompartment protein [Candidatus Sumerlaeota bacterium]|nr:EutN/CcmL family microcompartment protein [Candidatus Sumerlaeota bacterium]
MDLARVIGKFVATRKDPSLEGVTILLVQPLDAELNPVGEPEVATDALGIRGVGELVFLVSSGDAVYTGPGGRTIPVDAAVMGIVDEIYYREHYLTRISGMKEK